MKWLIFALFCLGVLLIFGLQADIESPETQLAYTGLFDNHELLKSELYGTYGSERAGDYFVVTEAIDVNGVPFKQITFFWLPDTFDPGVVVATVLPASKIKFIIDDEHKVPEVIFVFDQDWKKYGDDFGGILFWRMDYNDAQDGNLNYFIKSDCLGYAAIRLPKSMVKKHNLLFIP